ncbi:MAG: 3-isopropylmalate dehydratase large subunit [Hyphomicrobiales bacterium]|nr:3-isopropylmalate dehydratase large subunit [Hyphomicrobiales bacterium]
MAGTLFDKIYDAHVVARRSDGRDLVYMDRNLAHDLHAPIALGRLSDAGRSVRRPDLTFAVLDHSLSARRGPGKDGDTVFTKATRERAQGFGVHVFDLGDREQGISHVVAPERGIALPGATYACPDSHACTVGGLGALAFACGTTDLEHVFATQVLALKRPKTMRINLSGTLSEGVSAKDVVLKMISELGVAVGRGYAIEYAGEIVQALAIEGRLTVCNMAIEMGARTGLIAPDETTFEWLSGRPFAPRGADWDAAYAAWRSLRSDEDATYDADLSVDCGGLEPQVSWGTDPSQVIPVSGRIPDPAQWDPARRPAMERALDYMQLKPGAPIEGVPVNRVYIGSCTNSRLPDLVEAATVLRGRKVAQDMKALVVPGSTAVKREAEAMGLDEVFKSAGFYWGESGCSMCAGGMLDYGDPGDRCASTTNRNFEGRQGKGVRTHLVSPAMAAAAAVAGKIVDVRRFTEGG